MGIKRTIQPASEPITLIEAKAHLRVDHTDDDAYITALIKAARGSAEAFTQSSFFTQTWVKSASRFVDIMDLPRGIVQSIESVKYYDVDNVQQTVNAADYFLTSPSNKSYVQVVETGWPPSLYYRNDAVQITYITGYSDVADIPTDIKQAILMSIGHLYENRQDVIVGSQVNAMPMASKHLLTPHRVYYAQV